MSSHKEGRPEFCVLLDYFSLFRSTYLFPQHLVNFSCMLSHIYYSHTISLNTSPAQKKKKSYLRNSFLPFNFVVVFWNLGASYDSSHCVNPWSDLFCAGCFVCMIRASYEQCFSNMPLFVFRHASTKMPSSKFWSTGGLINLFDNTTTQHPLSLFSS